MTLEDLAQLYEKKRDELEQLSDEVFKLKQQYDQQREFDEKYAWCRMCSKKHRRNTQVERHHMTQKIPKQCLTKYDHIYDFGLAKRVRKEFPYKEHPNLYVWIYSEPCIACGHTHEVFGDAIHRIGEE